MGTIINMVSVSQTFSKFSGGNSISLSSKAAKKCLGCAGIEPSEIGLLINTGVYRYRNIGEPSIASLVQKRVMGYHKSRISRSDLPSRDNDTFSFDLSEGACGWLTGLQIIDGFIQAGDIRHGMAVTGDSDPFNGISVNYHFDTAAAAIILSGSEKPGGFSNFKAYYYPDFIEEFISATRFEKPVGKRGKRNILFVGQKKTYLENCIGSAVRSLKKYLNVTGLPMEEIDLVISSQCPAGLVTGLREQTGLGQKIIAIENARGRELHTAGLAFALKKSWDDGSFKSSENIIFLTVGSGISVSLALYQNKS
jgi:3-oxoacyl-[acyl-carrier-protein] synthase-3